MLKLDHEKNEGNLHNPKDETVIPADDALRRGRKSSNVFNRITGEPN